MKSIAIYTTFPSNSEAKKIVNFLLKNKLIACANFFPVTSSYWWRGKIINDREVVAILKTTSKNWPGIKAEIKKMHSYEMPCIEKIKIEANEDCERWIKGETKQ